MNPPNLTELVKGINGFQNTRFTGADEVQINPGDSIVCTTSAGDLSWGVFLGSSYLQGKGRYPRSTKRAYYAVWNQTNSLWLRKFINIRSRSRSWRMIKR